MVPTKCNHCGRSLFVEYTVHYGMHPRYYDGDNLRNVHLVVTCPDCGSRLPGRATKL